MSKKQIAQATAIIVVFSLFGKLLGFVREMVIAAIFGTTYRTDAYFIGLTGPDFIREVISGGVLTAVFIPVYTACQSKNDPQQTKTTLNTVATLLLIAMALSVIVGIPLAPYLVRVIAPEIDPATFTIAVQITRIIFPATVFMGLANFYGSLLNVQKHFVSPALAQIMLNIGIIGGLLLWGSKWGVNSLALGFLGGAALQFVTRAPLQT
jgi:putative peptidoglycan lipid II flippase